MQNTWVFLAAFVKKRNLFLSKPFNVYQYFLKSLFVCLLSLGKLRLLTMWARSDASPHHKVKFTLAKFTRACSIFRGAPQPTKHLDQTKFSYAPFHITSFLSKHLFPLGLTRFSILLVSILYNCSIYFTCNGIFTP